MQSLRFLKSPQALIKGSQIVNSCGIPCTGDFKSEEKVFFSFLKLSLIHQLQALSCRCYRILRQQSP